MPYIDPKSARELDYEVRQPRTVGELTYKLTAEVACWLDNIDTISYAKLAEVLAALECAKIDFVERVLKPYERKKMIENGDVYGRQVIEDVGGEFFGYREVPDTDTW